MSIQKEWQKKATKGIKDQRKRVATSGFDLQAQLAVEGRTMGGTEGNSGSGAPPALATKKRKFKWNYGYIK